VQRSTKYRNRPQQCAFDELAFRQREPLRAAGKRLSCCDCLALKKMPRTAAAFCFRQR